MQGRKGIPNLNPFVTVLIVCPLCSQVVLPTFTKMANGEISDITFYHINEAAGCAWKVIDPKQRTNGQCVGLLSNVRSGVDSRGNPAYINEADLAKGKSFDLEGLKPFIPGPLVPIPAAPESALDLLNKQLAAERPTPKFAPKAPASAPEISKEPETGPLSMAADEGVESNSETGEGVIVRE